MGLFICDICDKHLGLSPEALEHKCSEEDIRSHVESLRNAARTAETRLEDTRNAIFRMLEELPTLEGEQATVSTKWLRQLWDAAECRWWEGKTADSFLVRDLAKQRILVEASYLFRSQRFSKTPTSLEKLAALKEACEQARKTLEYGDGKFDLTPEDVLKG